MKNTDLDKILKNKQRHQRWFKVVACLSFVVALFTATLLMYPATALSAGEIILETEETDKGDILHVSAKAESEDDSVFVLSSVDNTGGIDEKRLPFDEEGKAEIKDDNQNVITTLCKNTDDEGKVTYTFSISENREAELEIPVTDNTQFSAELIENESQETLQEDLSRNADMQKAEKYVYSQPAEVNVSEVVTYADEGHDFAENITNVTVFSLNNGQWVPGTEFTDGTLLRVSIEYSIPENIVGPQNNTIWYQLPEGIALETEESGLVYDGSTPVGTYVIGTDGKIVITYNDSFLDNNHFNGAINFQGYAALGENEEETKIDFGTDGDTITIRPQESQHDISMRKNGSYDKATNTLTYTLTVSTVNGSDPENTITVNDWFQVSDTSVTYNQNSFKIVKNTSDGPQEINSYNLTIDTQNNQPHFSITELPALYAGESYVITYTATPGETTSTTGVSNVRNSAEASGGDDKNSSYIDISVSRQMISKSGYYDSATGKIKWTIVLNQEKNDIGNYQLSDKMTINGQEIQFPEGITFTVTAEDGSTYTYNSLAEIQFEPGDTKTYTITYETDPPSSTNPGESWSVNNEVEFKDEDDNYNTSTTVTGTTRDYGIWKGSNGTQAPVDGEGGTYRWTTVINVPESDGLDLKNILYTDTLHDAVRDDGTSIENSHYVTAQLLNNLTVTVDNTPLERGTDYNILDENGNEITDFSSTTHMIGFKVEFLESAITAIAGKDVQISYETYVRYEGFEAGENYTIKNTGAIPSRSIDAQTTYNRPKKLEKSALTSNDGNVYANQDIEIDYDQFDGRIKYRILIQTDTNTTGDITVTDYLPSGATLVNESVDMKFYYGTYELDSIWNGSINYIAKDHIVANQMVDSEGRQIVNFTIKEGYNNPYQAPNRLAIYYELDISNAAVWDDPSTENSSFTNRVEWGSETDGIDVTVNKEVNDLEKSGELLPTLDDEGNQIVGSDGKPILSNTIRYRLLVNVAGKDLSPDLDYITLLDELTVADNKNPGIIFRADSVKLYQYDENAEDYCGEEIDDALYAYSYDDIQHQLIFNLPDEMPCVLVYDYEIDRGLITGDLRINNQATLSGSSSSGGSDEIIIQDSSSGATATKKDLTIYKVDSTDYGTLLPGAEFELSQYIAETNEWVKKADFTTDTNGEFVLSRTDDEQFENFNFEDNTLYRLEETKAPEGYSILSNSLYFVWVKDEQTVDQAKSEIGNGKKPDDVNIDSIRFLTASGSIYIPNEPTTLTVRKLWQNKDGTEISSPPVDEVEVELHQQAVRSNRRQVTIIGKGSHPSWSGTPYQTVLYVGDGSNLTIHINGAWEGNLIFAVANSTPEEVEAVEANGQRTFDFTVNNITDDISIEIYYSQDSWNVPINADNLSLSDYTMPSFVNVGESIIYEKPVVLSSDNGWSYSWNDLPKTNSDGNMVFYSVKEVTEVPGFETIYSINNNDGVQAGELVVVNRRSGDAYVLPETGGSGSEMFLFGGLLMIASAGVALFVRRKRRMI